MKKERFPWLFLALLVMHISMIDYVTAGCNSNRPGGVQWANKWDGRAYFDCGTGKSVTRVRSVHQNCQEDRIWSYSCHTNAAAKYCFWTPVLNSYDGVLNFNCPHDGFIAGMDSWHSNRQEDRQFKFKCCHNHDYRWVNCRYSLETTYDSPINYLMPHGYYLAGAYSTHSNRHEDRRWKFWSCRRQPVKLTE